jgi:hypothetical protein
MIAIGAKSIEIAGGVRTFNVVESVFRFDPPAGTVVVNSPGDAVTVFNPWTEEVTVMIRVQLAFSGMVDPVNETEEPPAVLVPAQVPPVVPVAVNPDGKVSVSVTPVIFAAVGFANV